jgi:diguanylate cyclase (GGDEF)-like protein/PAS domain S-box-containing protein
MARLSPSLLLGPLLVLIAALLATAAAVAWNAHTERSRYLEDFRAIAEERAGAIEMLLNIALTRQTDVGALFLASQQVEAQEFRDFVTHIYRRQPTVASSIAFAVPVERRDRAQFEHALAIDYGLGMAQLRDLLPDGREVTAPERRLYYPIRFSEPVDFPRERPGLDIGGTATSASALERAIASGQPTVADYRAVGDNTRRFKVMLAVYRTGILPSSIEERHRQLVGVSIAVYRYDRIVEQSAAHSSIVGQHIAVFDSLAAGDKPVHVYRSRMPGARLALEPANPAAALRIGFSEERRIQLADRTLSLVFIPARPMALVAFIDQRGKLIGLGGSMLSILFAVIAHRGATARRARRDTEHQLQLAATVFRHAHEAILITDADAIIVDVNQAFLSISGYEKAEVIGKNPRILQSGQHHADFYADFWRALIQTGRWQGQFWNRRRDGQLFATETTISAVKNMAGQIIYYIGLFSDITERKRHQERIEHLALYDPLTDLPNRALAIDRLQQSVAVARRESAFVAICYLDLDDFKPVNDRHGHDAGDRLLGALGKRLLSVVREHDTVARLGGDEFLVLLTKLASQAQLAPILTRLREAACTPVVISAGTEVTVTTSIGVALFPYDAEEPEVLLRQADQAMYQAKALGRNRIQMFSPETPDLLAAPDRSGPTALRRR